MFNFLRYFHKNIHNSHTNGCSLKLYLLYNYCETSSSWTITSSLKLLDSLWFSPSSLDPLIISVSHQCLRLSCYLSYLPCKSQPWESSTIWLFSTYFSMLSAIKGKYTYRLEPLQTHGLYVAWAKLRYLHGSFYLYQLLLPFHSATIQNFHLAALLADDLVSHSTSKTKVMIKL